MAWVRVALLGVNLGAILISRRIGGIKLDGQGEIRDGVVEVALFCVNRATTEAGGGIVKAARLRSNR